VPGRMAIIVHIDGLFTVGGGIREFIMGCCGALGFRRLDWSSPALHRRGIVVLTTVGAVEGGAGAAAGDSLGVATLGAGGVLAFVS